MQESSCVEISACFPAHPLCVAPVFITGDSRMSPPAAAQLIILRGADSCPLNGLTLIHVVRAPPRSGPPIPSSGPSLVVSHVSLFSSPRIRPHDRPWKRVDCAHSPFAAPFLRNPGEQAEAHAVQGRRIDDHLDICRARRAPPGHWSSRRRGLRCAPCLVHVQR